MAASDADGDALSVVSNTAATHGSVAMNTDGSYTYTPDSGYLGTDSWTYTIGDGAETAVGTVNMNVVPATEIWVSTGMDTSWNTASNWQSDAVPTALDDVIFDANYSNADCVFSGSGVSSGANLCYSLNLTNGYSGTLHLQQSFPAQIGPGGINQSSGDIEQDSGQDINTGGDYNWSGGSINVNSAFLADVNVAPGKTISMSGTGTTWTTGSNLKLTNGGHGVLDAPNGSLTFTKNAGLSIDNQSAFNWVDGNMNTTGVGVINNAGTFVKSIGTNQQVSTALPVINTGMFQMQQGELDITGRLASGYGTYNSYVQTNGTIDLYNSTDMVLNANFEMDAGNFYTEGRICGMAVPATGWVYINGGIINLNHGNQNAIGKFFVTQGQFYMGANAEWDCKVDCSAPRMDVCDTIGGHGVTIGGTFKAIGFNIPVGGVPADKQWGFLFSLGMGAQINGEFSNWILDFNDGSGKSWFVSLNAAGDAYSLQS